ncbi:MAG TPA: dienelactone hydrolase family protein [Patescibacteria group bacterium]|nr:dienelactone hydrolase family protein [Patescibacteria group bacterium]
MKMLPVFLAALTLIIHTTTAEARIVTREVPYSDGGVTLTGYYAYDDQARKPMPGVIVIHEWWGANQYARKRAEQLAGLGYAAFAIDMYGAGKAANNPDEAKKLSAPFYANRSLMYSRAMAGLNKIKTLPNVDATRLAAVGYCFGGTVALELARKGEDLKGVVSLHGGLAAAERAEPGRVKAQVLVLNGGADAMVTAKERANFVAEMQTAGVNFKNIVYPDATHAFSNPKATEIGKRFNLPIAYNEAADEKSFSEEKRFLARVFTRPVEEKQPDYVPAGGE